MRCRVSRDIHACAIESGVTVDTRSRQLSVQTPGMKQLGRRQFPLVAGALWAAAIGARAQPAAKPYRVGVLGRLEKTLQQGLHELGYLEGRDIVLEVRDPGGKPELTDALASELVGLKVAVIVASNPNAVFSAKRATSTIPIVMMHTPDPVRLGLVSSFTKPGGNITGVTTLSEDMSIKQLELLKEAIPRVSRVALVWNPDNPWHPATVKALQARSGTLGLQVQALEVRGPEAFDRAFHAMTTTQAHAVLVPADPMTFFNRRQLAELAIRHRLPMMGSLPDYAEAGSIMSYWADTGDVYRRAASYVDRLLKGAKPADLPIEQPTKFELVANLRTAKALDIMLPRSIILRADRLIE